MNEKDGLIDLLIHDLKGPLSVASASVANLLHKIDRYGPLTDRQRRTLERIWRNTRRAQTLLQEMVEISRSEEGLFREERFPIAKALRESLLDAVEIIASPMAERIRRAKNENEFGLSFCEVLESGRQRVNCVMRRHLVVDGAAKP